MSPTSRASLKAKVSVVAPWGDVPVEFTIEGSAKKSDFLGLYPADQECSLGDYDASLLTKGRTSGMNTFIAPQDEGMYVIKLVRSDSEELASVAFHVKGNSAAT